MTHIFPFVGILRNQLEDYEKILRVSEGVHQEFFVQENVAHFNRGNHVSKKNINRSNGNPSS